jgi:membrane protease YdiL (CAAX protease family)
MPIEMAPGQLALVFFSMLLFSVLSVAVALWGWVLWQLATGQPLLPAGPLVSLSPPRWRGGTVFLAIATNLLINSIVFGIYLRAEGRLPRKAAAKAGSRDSSAEDHRPGKPDVTADRGKGADGPASGASDRTPEPADRGQANLESSQADRKLLSVVGRSRAAPKRPGRDDGESLLTWTEQMFVGSVWNALVILALPALIRLTSGSRLRDLGLSLNNWGRQFAIGVAATLVAAPIVYSVQIGATRIWVPHEHDLQKMLEKEQFGFGVASLAILSAVILAPIAEELMFRGIFQRWCIDFFDRRMAGVRFEAESAQTPLRTALDGPRNGVSPSWEGEDHAQPQFQPAHQEFGPPGSAQGHFAGWHPSRASVILGIGLTSFVFGAIHFKQWPAPFGIGVLAALIGAVYHRTGSLTVAIAMHATFNGFSTLLMFLTVLVGAPNEAGKLIEGAPDRPAAIVSVERGVWAAQGDDLDVSIPKIRRVFR